MPRMSPFVLLVAVVIGDAFRIKTGEASDLRKAPDGTRARTWAEVAMCTGYESCLCKSKSPEAAGSLHVNFDMDSEGEKKKTTSKSFIVETERKPSWTSCQEECPNLCEIENPAATFDKCLPVATGNGHVAGGTNATLRPAPMVRHDTKANDPTRYACVCNRNGFEFVFGLSTTRKGIYTWGGNGCRKSCPWFCEKHFSAKAVACLLDKYTLTQPF